MKKLSTLFLILAISCSSVFAYSVKVYDQFGNRVGTYRKEGENYVLYDFNDKKVENAEDLIKNAPSKKTLSELNGYLYDENMNPIGGFYPGLLHRKYYYGWGYTPECFYETTTPYIVRPRANSDDTIKIEKYPYNNHSKTNVTKTGF